MKIMLLDGSDKQDHVMAKTRQIIEELCGRHEIAAFTLKDLQVSTCCGFFCCWLKTPGICIIDDIGREITKCAATSDCWVFLTPITFGGYSSELKKAIDRMAPLMLPYFTKFTGEVHHIPRYEKHSHLIVVGSAERHDVEAEDIFKALVHRNSINFCNNTITTSIVLQDDRLDNIKEKIVKAFNSSMAL